MHMLAPTIVTCLSFCSVPLSTRALGQEPYIVTSCNHCFCMKHEHDARLKQSTCPGCGNHLPLKTGVTFAHYRTDKEQRGALHGLQPDCVLDLAASAVHFWCALILHESVALP